MKVDLMRPAGSVSSSVLWKKKRIDAYKYSLKVMCCGCASMKSDVMREMALKRGSGAFHPMLCVWTILAFRRPQ